LNNAAKSIAAMAYETLTNPFGTIEGMGKLVIGGINTIVPDGLKIPGQQDAEDMFRATFAPTLDELYRNPLGPAMAVGLMGGAMSGAAGIRRGNSIASVRAAVAETINKSLEPLANERGAIGSGEGAFGKNNGQNIIADKIDAAKRVGLTQFDFTTSATSGKSGSPAFEITGGRSLNDLTQLARGQEAAVFVPKNSPIPEKVFKVPYPKTESSIGSTVADAEANYRKMITEFMSRDKAVGSGTMRLAGSYEAGGQKIPIFEQKYFEGNPASEMMIDKYMSEKGFTRAPKGAKWEYERREGDLLRVVGDLLGGGPEGRSKNAFFTKDGRVEVFDSMMKVVKWAQVEAGRAKGAPGMENGGSISGYGGGDIVPANLEPGEFVVRKEAVRQYGAGFFKLLNGL
jgi:hypothetical protein